MKTASKDLEHDFAGLDAPHFIPYVGSDYPASKHRILMLGEANHGGEEDGNDRHYTQKTVRTAIAESLLDQKKNHFVRYIRNMEAMLTGKAYGESDNIWGKLAYSVFFQEMYTAPHDSGKNVTSERLERARKSFFITLDLLRPQYVIIWGTTLLKKHWLLSEGASLVLDPDIPVYACKKYPDIRFWATHHPSRDFSYASEHQRWRRVLHVKALSANKELCEKSVGSPLCA